MAVGVPRPARLLLPVAIALSGMAGWAGAQVPSPPGPGEYDPAIPTVTALRGFDTGETFSLHADVARVLEGLDAASDRVRVESYGKSVEGRDLWLAWISSPSNLGRLDSLRARNLASVRGNGGGEADPDRPIFVWLSFGVHGDEASSTEAALELIYRLAASRAPTVAGWLEQAVVVVDPLLNPDGHERYVTWFRSVAGPVPDPDPAAREHRPPWPGGRTNHWYSDLNRDWSWGVQPETRARIAAYLATMPQVHVDFHEMDPGSTYFFFPAAQPIHGYYPASTREWGGVFGAANAAAFDAQGWPYFSGEDYDLYYPGYGDSWPSFLGATGMTYEQAGGGGAGLVLAREGEEPLTLIDRVARHLTAALTTIDTAVQHRVRRLADFDAFWTPADRRVPGAPGGWAIAGDARAQDALAELLVRQGIRVDVVVATARGLVLEPFAGSPDSDSLAEGTLVVPSDQPFGRYAAALIEPDVSLPDTTLFYDITGWSLPFLHDLDAWRVASVPETGLSGWTPSVSAAPGPVPPGTVAVAWPYADLSHVIAAGRLAAAGVRVRVAGRPFRAAGRAFPRGSFLVWGAGQGIEGGGPAALDLAAREVGSDAVALSTSDSEDGIDVGSGRARIVVAPRVALASGPGTRPTSVGTAWHLLGVEAGLPLDVVRLGDFAAAPGLDEDSLGGLERAPLDLTPYTAIVLPDAESASEYEAALGAEGARRLEAWVRGGGTLVAIRAAAAWVADSSRGLGDLALTPERPPPAEAVRLAPQAVRDQEDIRSQIPGTLLSVVVDTTATLGYGYADGRASVLVREPTELELAEEGNAWVFADAPPLAGYLPEDAGSRLAGRPYAVVRELGAGSVVAFADDPSFRGITYGLKKLYLNATLLLPAAR